jgi:uncharacterized protein YunC (DUF1805 family)
LLIHKRIKAGRKYIEALLFNLGAKNLIILKGTQGYVMCGYLNLRAAEKFKDVAVKVTGVSTIEQAKKSYVHSSTKNAKRQGIYKGQSIKEVLKIIS